MIIRCTFLFVFTATSLYATFSPAPLFRDGAVLQHGKPVPVWGSADPGREVTVTFGEQTVSATADTDGRWLVELAPLVPSTEPAEMVIEGEETLRIVDILVGEVWLASGQSNMEWSISRSYDADLEPATANWPMIREFNFPRTANWTPQEQGDGEWVAAVGEDVSDFSAVGYHFARDLHQGLEMPVGIINSSWGGTRVESWIDPWSLEDAAFAAVRERGRELVERIDAQHEERLATWRRERDEAAAAGEPFSRERPSAPSFQEYRHAPSVLYNGMIHPLTPYALRGAIWYQGESNAGQHTEYHDLFSTMIQGWRRVFEQDDFPFYWVQLAEFRAGGPQETTWAFLREAQTRTLSLPATGQAVTLDVGDVHDIHPRDKRTVGRRLARLALNRTYDREMVDSGPVFEHAEFDGPTVRVHFRETTGGLRTTAVAVRGFELAGADRRFIPASAGIEGDSVTVTSDLVPEPVAVRYGWRNAPEATLSNGAGLPAVPFRTDTWTGERP